MKFGTFIAFPILIVLCFSGFGQHKNTHVIDSYDSLWENDQQQAISYLKDRLADPGRTTKQKSDFAFKLADGFFFTGKLDSAIKYLDYATLSYKNLGLDSLQFESIFQSGVYSRRSGKVPQAREYYVKALGFAREIKQPMLEGDALNAIGVTYYSQGDMVNALQYYLDAMTIFEKAGNKPKLGKSYNNIGIIYKVFNNYDKAIEYYNKSINIRLDLKLANKTYPAFFNINELYHSTNRPQQALNTTKKLLKIALDSDEIDLQYHAYDMLLNDYLHSNNLDSAKLNIDEFAALAIDDYDSAKVERHIARVYLKSGQPDKAIPLFLKSLNTFKSYNHIVVMAESMLYLSDSYFALGNFKKSISYAQDAYRIAKREQSNSLVIRSLEKLHKAYLANSDFKAAYDYLSLAKIYQDSTYNESKASIAGSMEASQKLAEREKDNLVLQKNAEIRERTIENQRLLIAAAVIGALLVIIVAYLLIKTQGNKKRLAEIEAQMSREQANRVEEELAYKNQEIVNFAVQITEKNEFLEKLNIQVKKLNGRAKELPEELKQIVELVKAHFSITEQREEFHQHVENVYDAFFQRLESKYPGLSMSEKRLAALIRINLTSKDIASVVNISPKSVDMNRYRLRKKMGLTSEENLNEILQNL
ncbi:MAG: tetratricopeptide repeat protein [Bacteroidota bacterium]